MTIPSFFQNVKNCTSDRNRSAPLIKHWRKCKISPTQHNSKSFFDRFWLLPIIKSFWKKKCFCCINDAEEWIKDSSFQIMTGGT